LIFVKSYYIFLKGTWEIEIIFFKEADLAAYLLSATPERAKIMDFTTAIHLIELLLLVPYPLMGSEIDNLSAIFRPFSLTVSNKEVNTE